MTTILTENNLTPEQLQMLQPKIRALVQQETIVKQLMQQYRKRIASFMSHPDNVRHVNPLQLKRDTAQWLNAHAEAARNEQPDDQPAVDLVPFTAENITQDQINQFLRSTEHPNRGTWRTDSEAKSPIVAQVSSYTLGSSTNTRGEPTKRRYTITLATEKSYADDPKSWKKALITDHIQSDINHIFGAENVSDFDLTNKSLKHRVNYSVVPFFSTTVTFDLKLPTADTILSPVQRVQTRLVVPVKRLAKTTGSSYHDVLNGIRVLMDIPIVESVVESFNKKASRPSGKYVIVCNLTDVSPEALYMTPESEWTADLNEAYVTDYTEAEDLLTSMMLSNRVSTGITVKVG